MIPIGKKIISAVLLNGIIVQALWFAYFHNFDIALLLVGLFVASIVNDAIFSEGKPPSDNPQEKPKPRSPVPDYYPNLEKRQ